MWLDLWKYKLAPISLLCWLLAVCPHSPSTSASPTDSHVLLFQLDGLKCFSAFKELQENPTHNLETWRFWGIERVLSSKERKKVSKDIDGDGENSSFFFLEYSLLFSSNINSDSFTNSSTSCLNTLLISKVFITSKSFYCWLTHSLTHSVLAYITGNIHSQLVTS